jgi:hypothetical protein
MKYRVSVEADDPEAAAAIAYALLNGEVPRKLDVRDAADVVTDIQLQHAIARDLKAAGKSITAKEVDEILARI